MRRYWIVGIIASSLLLASCGAKASIDQALSSLGSSPNVQIHLTANASGAGSAQAQPVLNSLSVDMRYSSSSGSALSQSANQVNSEIVLNSGTQIVADLREVDSNLYFLINLDALTSIPGVNIPAQYLAIAQLTIGGRWFEATKSLLTTYLPTTTVSSAQVSKEQAAAREILDALTALIEATPYTTLNNGYSQTGTLEAVEKAVLPAINSFTGQSLKPSAVKGTYSIGITMANGSATGGSIGITAPNGTLGDMTVGLVATVTHNSTAVEAPSNATVITPSLIQGLLGQVKQAGTNGGGVLNALS